MWVRGHSRSLKMVDVRFVAKDNFYNIFSYTTNIIFNKTYNNTLSPSTFQAHVSHVTPGHHVSLLSE